MGWSNSELPWNEFEARLSGRLVEDPLAEEYPAGRHRQRPIVPPISIPTDVVPYAELHAHSNFSFLDGASDPESLVYRAALLGLSALALTDHDGFYGAIRFASAARDVGLPTVFGAELSVDVSRSTAGEADPHGSHLVVLARNEAGYAALSTAISHAQLAGEKGRPVYDLPELAAARDQFLVLTSCRKGLVRTALRASGHKAAAAEVRRLVELFGADNVAVELIDHQQPTDYEHNVALAGIAGELGLPTVATNNVHYAVPADYRLATVLAAIRARRALDEIDPWLPAAGVAHLRSGAEMAERFRDFPGAVARSVTLANECAFRLGLKKPRLPPFPLDSGETESSELRRQTMLGMAERYQGTPDERRAYEQAEKELAVITELDFPGYFLIVHSLVKFCQQEQILCQGRGSAANSVVCYALGITNIDPIKNNLLFERFLAPERDGPPDIDIDIESGRREEVIQHVYKTYDRLHTAQVANVISYRPKSALRDVAKAFGFSPGQQDAWSKLLERGSGVKEEDIAEQGMTIPTELIDLTNRITKFPRHLGIHSGGMVICDQPVSQIVPVEWARMANRSVIQWDKDDCAEAGLVKFDLLGLGMLSALHHAFDFIAENHGVQLELRTIPVDDSAVYDMLCEADTIGVFQVESRAQMATLPRLKPRELYDLVVEVALIRPGPIQGNSVHPYIRRANGLEEITYDHPLLENALRRTKGVPLFQEQLMQMAVDIAGFSPADADLLRRAISSKRSEERLEQLRKRFYDGMRRNGVEGEVADRIYTKIKAFANFGFPESHAYSFAHIAYVSAWIKRYYPAAFCAALLKAQPMGFYSPQTLIADARRHGVTVLRPDINTSDVHADLVLSSETKLNPPDAQTPAPRWGSGGPVVRTGLTSVRTISEAVATRLVTARCDNGPFTSLAEVARCGELSAAAMEALATAGAFTDLGVTRRAGLWQAAAAATEREGQLPGLAVATVSAPPLPTMSAFEILAADMWATGFSTTGHPADFIRDQLRNEGAIALVDLGKQPPDAHIRVGGVVTHRQRPATAGGVTFLNLEDETGMVNVVCSPGLWKRYRRVARTARALLIIGWLRRSPEGVMSVYAERLAHLDLRVPTSSRDFR